MLTRELVSLFDGYYIYKKREYSIIMQNLEKDQHYLPFIFIFIFILWFFLIIIFFIPNVPLLFISHSTNPHHKQTKIMYYWTFFWPSLSLSIMNMMEIHFFFIFLICPLPFFFFFFFCRFSLNGLLDIFCMCILQFTAISYVIGHCPKK